jgi:ATP-dependent HslUV protease ATP-binding subunit HslU
MIEELAEQAYQDEVVRLKVEVDTEARGIALEEVTTALMNSKLGIRDNLNRDTARSLVESGLVDSEEVEIESSVLDYAITRTHAVGEKEYQILDEEAPVTTTRSILSSRAPFSVRGSGMGPRSHRPMWRLVTVRQAMKAIADKSATVLTRNKESELKDRAKQSMEERGIVFIDEFDKMISDASEEGSSFNQKRKGVEKELLTLIEGTSVPTKKLGNINTDHIVFICAGAFSAVSPKEIMPELQGRLPIRCTMKALTEADFVSILETVEYSLLKTQRELLLVDGVEIEFTKCGVSRIAKYAVEMNHELVNTGARRLTTIMSIVLEEIKFNATEMVGSKIIIDEAFVVCRLGGILKGDNEAELRKFVL